jgi:hypothetical protein
VMDYLLRLKRRFALLRSTVSIEERDKWGHDRRDRVLAPFFTTPVVRSRAFVRPWRVNEQEMERWE